MTPADAGTAIVNAHPADAGTATSAGVAAAVNTPLSYAGVVWPVDARCDTTAAPLYSHPTNIVEPDIDEPVPNAHHPAAVEYTVNVVAVVLRVATTQNVLDESTQYVLDAVPDEDDDDDDAVDVAVAAEAVAVSATVSENVPYDECCVNELDALDGVVGAVSLIPYMKLDELVDRTVVSVLAIAIENTQLAAVGTDTADGVETKVKLPFSYVGRVWPVDDRCETTEDPLYFHPTKMVDPVIDVPVPNAHHPAAVEYTVNVVAEEFRRATRQNVFAESTQYVLVDAAPDIVVC
ncbi:hypothetical protein HDU82_003412 [Entophlyctis luteolus]|nr:hypothetical protein HDU82_003412 [Entophlyctis luteolus]